MSDIVIKVEHLAKQYRLGEIGTGSLAHDINRWWHKLRGNEDPYLMIGEENDRTKKGNSDYVWALQDINFDVKKGEVIGIIGRNGAGKSTLLKILSNTTSPTTGHVKIKGRIASLLEVGTGFHPELSGRDNIFLNGAILGMTKLEIKNKFDEIVAFAGVEKYIDTPVKRYSSGMYVRLAFGVAAHLEPEILIVDEVLAVGDAEFQRKALGKMQDVSNKDGRTVLFVSHQMGSISQLCSTALLLYNGQIKARGNVQDVINEYLTFSKASSKYLHDADESKNKAIYFEEIHCTDSEERETNNFNFSDNIRIRLKIKANQKNIEGVKVGVALIDRNEARVFSSLGSLSDFKIAGDNTYNVGIKLPNSLFAPGDYKFLFAIQVPNNNLFDIVNSTCSIKIYDNGTEFSSLEGYHYGNIIIHPEWYSV